MSGQNQGSYLVRGIVRDSISEEPLPYASVVVSDKRHSAVADDKGIFEVTVPSDASYLTVNYMGYDGKTVALRRNSLNMYVVYLSPTVTELGELVVKKKKYSKRNNPAVDFLNRLKKASKQTDPFARPYYSYDKYEYISLGLNDFNSGELGAGSKFGFLEQHVDTSDVSGKPYLCLMVKEKRSKVVHRSSPEALRERVEATRQSGIDEIVDQESMRTFFEDVLREIDLYSNDINLLQNRFVSPLSRIAPDFYRFYLTDTVDTDAGLCAVLSFYPRNKASFGFNGHLYVPVGDTTMFVSHIDMTVPQDINLNFVDNLYISQDFIKAPDGTRHKTSDNLTLELSYMGKANMYATRRTSYDGHSSDALPDSVFGASADEASMASNEETSSDYWRKARMVDLPHGESDVDAMMGQLRKVPVFYWGEKIMKVVFGGYVPTGNPSRFDIGPVNSMLSFNTVENVRLRFGGMTTAALSPRWFGRFFTAYGVKDHRWKYGVEIEHTFIDKNVHSREFPMRSLKLESGYDLMFPGEEYEFTSPDNIVLSLKRMKDDRAFYRRRNHLSFVWETARHFSVDVGVANERYTTAPTMAPLTDGYGNAIGSLDYNKVELTLRYAPGEKIFQTRSYRIPVNLDAPSISLHHVYAPKGGRSHSFGVNKTSLHVAKRWWMSAFGYLDTAVGGGHVWGATDWLSLFTPNVNLSYTIQPESFALLNPMEVLCTSFAMWDVTYWANGAILDQIPLLKKLKLRETAGIRGYWGTLRRNSDPSVNPGLPSLPLGMTALRLDHGPYMEATVGIDNIFKVLRVEYVWRLNYKDVPYEIDRNGVRIAVHVTF